MPTEPVSLKLEKIRMDGGTQPRAEMSESVIDEYAQAWTDGADFPPVDVFFDGTDYWLADGFQRACAADKADMKAILANVHQGTQQDAQWFSYGANQKHGLRRTNADKERAVRAALGHAKAGKMSDNAIADHCGVSHTFVAKIRELTCNRCKSAVREGRDGRTIKVANIGKTPRVKSTEYIDNETGEVLDEDRLTKVTTDAPAEQESPATPTRKPRGVGLEIAYKAIDLLRSIPAQDAMRSEGLQRVAAWIADNS